MPIYQRTATVNSMASIFDEQWYILQAARLFHRSDPCINFLAQRNQ
jgi:hypothetical protein